MIFFVWSLILSAVQFARRQRLISVLSEFFITNCSRTTVLMCRRIPFLSCSSRNTSWYEKSGSAIEALRKTNSEPCLPASLVAAPIYRTDEVEFVVIPNTPQLDIVDWNVFSSPTIGSIPRVYFIAFLGAKNGSCDKIMDSLVYNNTFAASDEHSESSDYAFCSGLSPTLVDNLCNKIAHRRGHPWEVLYECTLYDFYNVAFAWSQNALFDIGGEAFVKMMQVISLPESFFFPTGDSDSNQSSSSLALDCGDRWSSSRSVSPEPLSLLEILFQREHGFPVETDDYWRHYASSTLLTTHSINSALHMDQLRLPAPNSCEVSSGVRSGRSVNVMRQNSLRNRTFSVSPERALTLPKEAAPLYVKYLQEQNELAKLPSRHLKNHSFSMEAEDSGITGEQLLDTPLSLSAASPEQSRKVFPKLLQAVAPNAMSTHLSNSSTANCTSSSCIVNSDSAVRPVGNRFDGTFSSQKSNLQTEFSQVLMGSIPAAVEPSQVLSQLPVNDKQELMIEENKSATVTVTEINDKDGLTHNEVAKPSVSFGNNLESEAFTKLEVLDALDKDSQKSKPMWCSVSVGSRAIHQKEELTPLVENFLCKDGSKSNDRAGKVRSISVGTNGSHSNDKHISPIMPRAMLSLSSGRRHSSLSPRPQFLLNASQNDRRNSFCTSSFLRSPMRWCSEDQSSFGSHMFQAPSGSMRRQLHTIGDGGKGREKPPGILVFTGDNEELFVRISGVLASMISPDTYTVFHLSYEALCKQPWIGREAACLIVADTAHLDDKCWARLHQYFNNSGKMLFLCQNNLLASLCACDTSKKSAKLLKMAFGERQSKELGKDFENFLKKTLRAVRKGKKVNQTFHAKDLIGGYKYSVALSKNEDSPLLLYMENAAQQASALFSDATSEQLLSSGTALIADALSRLSIETVPLAHLPALTQGYFICEYDRMPWDMQGMRFDEKFGTLPKLLLKQIKKHGPLPEPSKELLPVEVRTRMEHLPDFDDEIYFRRLKTPKLGKALFYVPVCETTMEIGKSLAFAMPEEPVVVVAQQQIKGRGRSGNQWLSPVGCAMFTFNYMLPVGSNLANNVSFIQHILCVAIVDGIRSLHKDLENFPLKIKWPNDVYYGRTHKMGGLIVNATTIDGRTVCTLGAGLNLANSKPTVCINDLLPTEMGFKIKREDYIANTLNKFEYYMDIYQNLGQEAFLKHYYRFWLHSREEVTLSDTNEKAVIRGLDQYGFLEVRSRQSGQIMAVHPDGNTFDMMKGLITTKYR